MGQPLYVGVPGFEPGMTGPESVVLPLHHTPMSFAERFISVLRLQRYGLFLNHQTFSPLFFKKNPHSPSAPPAPLLKKTKNQRVLVFFMLEPIIRRIFAN